ncbi:MAG: hypothetical protein V4648_06115 [Bacteroidota bacterium]
MDYSFLQKLHSGWAYLAVLLLFVAAINATIGYMTKKEFLSRDRKIALFALIAIHIQLVVGMILYFVSPLGKASLGEMKDAALRLTSLEHPLLNLIAIALITIGWSRHKKAANSEGKFKAISFFYAIGLVLILVRIPWNSWLN